MTKQEKYRLLLLMAGVATLLLFLAAAITRMQMQPGDPFPIKWQRPPQGESAPFGNGYWFLVLIRGLLILLAITVPIYIFVNLLTPEGRRRLLKDLIRFLILFLILYILLSLLESASNRNQEKKMKDQPFQLGEGEAATEGLATTEEPEVTEPSPWLDVGICLGLAFLLAIIITVLAWGIYRASRERAGDAITRLADEAQEAVDALQAGGNIRDTVIRCYIQMTLVLAVERNVRREEAMTPHEFEQILLTKLKLPETPVQRLTRLFEAVRYGDYHPGKREELEAIDSLSAIASACKSVKASS
jgi:hypothetical protein